MGSKGFKPLCRAVDPVRGGFDSHTFPPDIPRPREALRVRALALISGGLDSILAARLIMDQDVEVLGVSFESPCPKN